MVRAAILQIEKDKGIEVTDEMIVDIIAKEVKKRNESENGATSRAAASFLLRFATKALKKKGML